MGSEVTQITCGRCHTLAYLASSNKLYSFGLCGNGQLGIGTISSNKLTPFEIKSLDLSKFSSTNNNNKESKYLNSIYAGGDQSFILYSKVITKKRKKINKFSFSSSFLILY
jgi:E3 ubiquitin-protein ligase HERC4